MSKFHLNKISAVVLILFSTSCVPLISFLPTDSNVTYPPTSSIKVYSKKPDEPHIVLGMIIGTGENYEKILDGIQKKAMSIGADAIIIKTSTQKTTEITWPSFDRRYNRSDKIYSKTIHYKLEGFAIKFEK